MLARVKTNLPEARIDGFMVEPMVSRPHALEIIVGMSIDPTFGPMMLFGAGGVAVEVLRDTALALPPLDALLARRMIAETRIARLLAGYRDRPAADIDALADVLVRVSDLIVSHREIRELDINPLLVDESGVIAIDARLKLASEQTSPRNQELSIRPYPAHLEKAIIVDGIGRSPYVRFALTMNHVTYRSSPLLNRTISACVFSPDGGRFRMRSWPI